MSTQHTRVFAGLNTRPNCFGASVVKRPQLWRPRVPKCTGYTRKRNSTVSPDHVQQTGWRVNEKAYGILGVTDQEGSIAGNRQFRPAAVAKAPFVGKAQSVLQHSSGRVRPRKLQDLENPVPSWVRPTFASTSEPSAALCFILQCVEYCSLFCFSECGEGSSVDIWWSPSSSRSDVLELGYAESCAESPCALFCVSRLRLSDVQSTN